MVRESLGLAARVASIFLFFPWGLIDLFFCLFLASEDDGGEEKKRVNYAAVIEELG